MSTTIKTFASAYLKDDLGLPSDPVDSVTVISDRIVGKSRWSNEYELIFRLPDQTPGEAWRVEYSRGATESQDERPWEYTDNVSATLVREVEKVVKVWEPVPDSTDKPAA